MIPCTLYLVRHGETDWNVSKTTQGQLDIPLNANGEEQAVKMKTMLSKIHFDALFSSDLIRAKRTAEILNLERRIALNTTKALRERHFGKYQGTQMDRNTFNTLHHLLEQYRLHPHITEMNVESTESVISRAITFIREISVAYLNKTVLLVTHGNLMIALLVHLGYIESQKQRTHLENLAYIKLESNGVEFKVLKTSGITINR